MVHDNPEIVEPDKLKELLLVVRDVLWVCDYYPRAKLALDYAVLPMLSKSVGDGPTRVSAAHAQHVSCLL